MTHSKESYFAVAWTTTNLMRTKTMTLMFETQTLTQKEMISVLFGMSTIVMDFLKNLGHGSAAVCSQMI